MWCVMLSKIVILESRQYIWTFLNKNRLFPIQRMRWTCVVITDKWGWPSANLQSSFNLPRHYECWKAYSLNVSYECPRWPCMVCFASRAFHPVSCLARAARKYVYQFRNITTQHNCLKQQSFYLDEYLIYYL